MDIKERIASLSDDELLALENLIFMSESGRVDPDYVLDHKLNTDVIQKLDLAVSAKGHFFKRDKKSIFHEKVEEIYANRAAVKKGMKKKEQMIEDIKNELKHRGEL